MGIWGKVRQPFSSSSQPTSHRQHTFAGISSKELRLNVQCNYVNVASFCCSVLRVSLPTIVCFLKYFFVFLFMLVNKISKRVKCCSFNRLVKHAAQPKRRFMFCHVFFFSVQISSTFCKKLPHEKLSSPPLKLLCSLEDFLLFSKCCASRVSKMVGSLYDTASLGGGGGGGAVR